MQRPHYDEKCSEGGQLLGFRWIAGVVVGAALSVVAPGAVRAQTSVEATGVAGPDASVEAALGSLASRAATVFVGQVVAIERHAGVVAIVFRVDRPVVGAVGASYTLREWAGMWPPGQWRYSVGERALVFLHGTSAAGLSSAVDGGEGVVPVMAAPDGTALVDVRRLGTRVLRQVGDPLPGAADGAMSLNDVVPLIVSGNKQGVRRPVRRPLPPSVVVPTGPTGTTTLRITPGVTRAGGVVTLRGVDDAAR